MPSSFLRDANCPEAKKQTNGNVRLTDRRDLSFHFVPAAVCHIAWIPSCVLFPSHEEKPWSLSSVFGLSDVHVRTMHECSLGCVPERLSSQLSTDAFRCFGFGFPRRISRLVGYSLSSVSATDRQLTVPHHTDWRGSVPRQLCKTGVEACRLGNFSLALKDSYINAERMSQSGHWPASVTSCEARTQVVRCRYVTEKWRGSLPP